MVIPIHGFKEFLITFNQLGRALGIELETKIKPEQHPHVAKVHLQSPNGIHTVVFPLYSIGDESGSKDTWIIATPKRITNDNKDVVRGWFLKILKQMQAKGMAMKNKSMTIVQQGNYVFDPDRAGEPGDNVVDYEQTVQRKPFPSENDPGVVVGVDDPYGRGQYLLHLKSSTNPPKSGGRPRKVLPQGVKAIEKPKKPKAEEKPKREKPAKPTTAKPKREKPEGEKKKPAKRVRPQGEKTEKPVSKPESEMLSNVYEEMKGSPKAPAPVPAKKAEKSPVFTEETSAEDVIRGLDLGAKKNSKRRF